MKVNFATKFNEKRKFTNHYNLKSNLRTKNPALQRYANVLCHGCPAMAFPACTASPGVVWLVIRRDKTNNKIIYN